MVRFPAGAGNFSLHHRVQNGSGAHPGSRPMGTRVSFPGGKAAGAWSWPLTSIWCRDQTMSGTIPSLSQYAFMAWCLVKAQGQLFYKWLFETALVLLSRCLMLSVFNFTWLCKLFVDAVEVLSSERDSNAQCIYKILQALRSILFHSSLSLYSLRSCWSTAVAMLLRLYVQSVTVEVEPVQNKEVTSGY
jgi:hypothetical protein